MMRALYNFDKTHSTSLTFSTDDLFFELPNIEQPKKSCDWCYVPSLSNGEAGYIPRSYVKMEEMDKLLEELTQQ